MHASDPGDADESGERGDAGREVRRRGSAVVTGHDDLEATDDPAGWRVPEPARPDAASTRAADEADVTSPAGGPVPVHARRAARAGGAA